MGDQRVRWPHCTLAFSLQGALQLRQDFGVVPELLEEERWGLSPELRQTLLMLSIFQRLDGALLCLLQQPLPKTQVHRRPSCCCESFPLLNPRLFGPWLTTLIAASPMLIIDLASVIPLPSQQPLAFHLLYQVQVMRSRHRNCPAAASTAWRAWSPLFSLEHPRPRQLRC